MGPADSEKRETTYYHHCYRCNKDWDSKYEYPSRCKWCKSNSFDVPLDGNIGRRGNITDARNRD